MSEEPLPLSEFSTTLLPAEAQFAAWQAGNKFMFDVLPPGEAVPAAFAGEARTYQLGHLLIGETRFEAQRYSRDRERIGRDGLEAFLVRLHLSGGHRGRNGKEAIEVRTGDIDVVDLAQPIDYVAPASMVIVLGIPRPMMQATLPMAEALHGLALPGDTGLGALLADHLRSLMRRLPEMTQAESDGVASATLAMMGACLGPAQAQMKAAPGRSGDAVLARIRQHIDEKLRSRAVTAETLCADFRLSRASLYRLFLPLGGVHRYIRDRRLVLAFVALADAAQRHRSIGEIAFELGFASEAHFGRLFRQAFGCTPGQARDLPRLQRELEAGKLQSGEPVYAAWLRAIASRER